jgi:hypothetical protein
MSTSAIALPPRMGPTFLPVLNVNTKVRKSAKNKILLACFVSTTANVMALMGVTVLLDGRATCAMSWSRMINTPIKEKHAVTDIATTMENASQPKSTWPVVTRSPNTTAIVRLPLMTIIDMVEFRANTLRPAFARDPIKEIPCPALSFAAMAEFATMRIRTEAASALTDGLDWPVSLRTILLMEKPRMILRKNVVNWHV